MYKKLDNRFSICPEELNDIIENNIYNIDVNSVYDKSFDTIKEYVGGEQKYNEWTNYINQEIHRSLPESVKENCKICQKEGGSQENKACLSYFNKANDVYDQAIILFVNVVETNQHLFKSKEVLKSITFKFFENFKYDNGELIFNAKKIDNILITHALLSVQEYYLGKETVEALLEINEVIEELETHKIVSKTTGRILYDYTKPQLKFLKKLQKYLEKKHLIDPNKPKDYIDKESLFESNNNLIPKVSIEEVYNYFQTFTQTINSEQEFYLSEEKLINFVKSTFVEQKPVKQRFDVGFNRDKMDVRSVFRKFMNQCAKYEGNSKNLKKKYFDIMNDSFYGFNKNDYDTFHRTNNKIPIKKMAKSK